MKIPKNVFRVWKKELIEEILWEASQEIGCDVRTLQRTIKSGKCHKFTYQKVNTYLLRKKNAPTHPLLLKPINI